MDAFVSFINHGILPFVGREADLNRLIAFWRLTAEAQRLRTALLVGEAGIGKSYLTEQLISTVNAAGGAAVHAKLRPGSTASVLPLLAQGLARSSSARRLLKNDPDPSLPSVSDALQRICHLRPTLVVIEDIHLLTEATVAEFSSLLAALADETLSVLCTARPVELGIRGTLEQYLVEEITLRGLEDKELRLLCSALFGFDTENMNMLLSSLRQATLGNPLAIRSALRGALSSGAIATDTLTGEWRLQQTNDALTVAFRNHVRVLSEGMAAHLSREERRAAEQLACLGEVFSAEAAEAMLSEEKAMLSSLIFKGIVLPATTPVQAVTQHASASHLLSFTHSLVHRYFLQSASPDTGALVRVMAEDLPLYSFDPVMLLRQSAATIDAPTDLLKRALISIITIARKLVYTADWGLAEPVCACAETIFGLYDGKWSPEDSIVLRGRLLQQAYYMTHLDYERGHARGREIVAEFVKLTGDIQTEEIAVLHLIALGSHYFLNTSKPELQESAIASANTTVSRYPQLRFALGYIVFLANVAANARNADDEERMRWVEARATEIAEDPEVTEECIRTLWDYLGKHIADVYDSGEELRERIALLETVYANSSDTRSRLLTTTARTELLGEAGETELVAKITDINVPLLRERGLHQHAVMLQLERLTAMTLSDASPAQSSQYASAIYNGTPDGLKKRIAPSIAARCYMIGFLTGRLAEWKHYVTDHLPPFDEELSWQTALILALDEDAMADTLRTIAERIPGAGRRKEKSLIQLLQSVLSASASTEDVCHQALTIFNTPVYCTSVLMMHCIAIDLLQWWATSNTKHSRSVAELRSAIAGCVVQILDWCYNHRLTSALGYLFGKYGTQYLEGQLLHEWDSRSAAARALSGVAESTTGPRERIHITMLDNILVQLPGEERPRKISGARQRTLLGVLAADAITGYKIEHREFCEMVSGGTDDPENARKYMNNAVKRLREIIGQEAINTETKVPRLDPEVVSVDLIDAHTHLNAARAALFEGSLGKASGELLPALRIMEAKVCFPSLYEEYFETLREEISLLHHDTIVKISRALLREGDNDRADELLQTAFTYYPDDEEIAELLETACTRLGKRFESELVRRKNVSF